MDAAQTEALHPEARGLDDRPLPEIGRVLVAGQVAAAEAVQSAVPEIAAAAEAMAQTIRQGGVIHSVAAGSSGLMAAADAQELGGTFSIPASQLRIHMAGGLPDGVDMPGATEDDTGDLEIRLADLSDRDTVIAVSASGTTPYTLAAAARAKSAGATLIAIANNPDTPLLQAADIAICVKTPPEVLSGSTRMGAGTAQKITLNMMSTLMAVALGHVHDGMMVNVKADNIKLRARAAGMVRRITGVGAEQAEAALTATSGAVKPAVLVALGESVAAAETLLRGTDHNLRAALARLNHTSNTGETP
ncbi:MAG: N-acetylmuramic acid 6-phosphate etherase [Pseudomonadota bacterium]